MIGEMSIGEISVGRLSPLGKNFFIKMSLEEVSVGKIFLGNVHRVNVSARKNLLQENVRSGAALRGNVPQETGLRA